MNNKTLDYYNQNADSFVAHTLNVEFEQTQNRFLKKLQPGAAILDFGCGSGRDTKYFLSKGFRVTATDGSEELCKIASTISGANVKCMLFQELADVEEYDGIWACSSILHLPKSELKGVLTKMVTATKPGGSIYTSFKYGEFEGERNGRYFTDFTYESFQAFLAEIADATMEEYWITGDVRPGRGDEMWLNLILRKVG